MSRLKDFKLPDLGEGLTEGEILSWSVKEGDTVTLNQVIVEVETAKAAVEVPSPYAGVVTKIHAEAGSTVDVGTPIITVDTDPSAGPLDAPAPALEPEMDLGDTDVTDMVPRPPADDAGPQGALIGEVGANGRTATLVGYGPRSVTAKRRPRADAPPVQRSEPATVAPAPPARVSAQQVGQTAAVRAGAVTVLAKPPVRKLAKDLGVDLREVTPSGPDGVVTRADVHAHVAAPAQPSPVLSPAAATSAEDRREPVRGVRKLTAQAMVTSAFTAPHVTEWVTLDVSPTMDLVERLRTHPDLRERRLSPLLVVAKAVCLALRHHPALNATFDDTAQEIVYKGQVNLGIAAATPRGLVVPNIKNADALPLAALATALDELVTTARAGRTQPAEMAGGTFTITNVGVFGVDAGTPILNPGETGILAVGAISRRPWVVGPEERIQPRWVTTLALSFDHRVVDGEQGSRFLADVAAILTDPAQALLY